MQPDNNQKAAKKSLAQNNFMQMPHQRTEENVSTDSVHEIKNDLYESLSYSKSPSGNKKGLLKAPKEVY